MELTLEEQTLLATFRTLDDLGKKELLRFASQQRKREAASPDVSLPVGQCKISRDEVRPEIAAEPIFTE